MESTIFTCIPEPTAEFEEMAKELEESVKQVADKTDLTLTEKIRDIYNILTSSFREKYKFDIMNIPEETAKMFENGTIEDNPEYMTRDEKEVYYAWDTITTFIAKYYYGHKYISMYLGVRGDDFLKDLKRLLVKGKTNEPDKCDETLNQIAKTCQNYTQFVTKIGDEILPLTFRGRKQAIVTMEALPRVEKLTLEAIEEEARKTTPITKYASARAAESIKRVYGCHKMEFFKKVLTHYHDWDEPAPVTEQPQ